MINKIHKWLNVQTNTYTSKLRIKNIYFLYGFWNFFIVCSSKKDVRYLSYLFLLAYLFDYKSQRSDCFVSKFLNLNDIVPYITNVCAYASMYINYKQMYRGSSVYRDIHLRVWMYSEGVNIPREAFKRMHEFTVYLLCSVNNGVNCIYALMHNF